MQSKRGFLGILILLVIFVIFISGCVPQEAKIPPSVPEEIVEEATAIQGLGNLCAGEQECIDFCSNNRGQCEEYCSSNENELCLVILPPESGENVVNDSEQDTEVESQGSSSYCNGSGAVEFTFPPMSIEDIELIDPIGLMIGGHVTPIDHGYYYAKNWEPSEGREDPSKFKDVFAPADGVISDIGAMPQEFSSSSIGDYRLVIDHSCTFYTIYIHINQLSPKLQAAFDERTREIVSVEAGELLGQSPAFDFSVHDEEVILPGFIVPEHYEREPWKIHTVDMFAYFVEPIKSQLLEKNVRQKEPRGGKIDYDIDGKLVGNWFLEGTNGYAGGGHLAFAYDGLDPSLIIVSIGDFKGGGEQFAVNGNAPDPADVSMSSGVVKYELVTAGYLTENGEVWDRVSFAKISEGFGYDQVMGTALVQLSENRKITFEYFPEKTASQVNEFTEDAKIYER